MNSWRDAGRQRPQPPGLALQLTRVVPPYGQNGALEGRLGPTLPLLQALGPVTVRYWYLCKPLLRLETSRTQPRWYNTTARCPRHSPYCTGFNLKWTAWHHWIHS